MKIPRLPIFVAVCLCLVSSPAFAERSDPDCDPPLRDEIQAAAERDANQAAKIYDAYVEPKSVDLLDDCFDSLNPQHWLDIGLPQISLEKLVGAVCTVTKSATGSFINKLNSQMSLSYLEGAATVGGGTGIGGGTGGGLKVRDTSEAARSNLLRLLR